MAVLVVLAAGQGRRFGGLKQLAAVGPGGEAIIDYTLRDAAEAGYARAIVVVRPDIAGEVVEHLAGWKHLPFGTVEQTGARGTAHAVLAARAEVDGPFAVANADDHYGAVALAELRARLDEGDLGATDALAVLYPVGATLPAEGFVRRARCTIEGERVAGFEELTLTRAEGEIVTDRGERVDPDTPVSMNLWGFHPAVFDRLATWVASEPPRSSGEHLLPDFVDAQLASESLVVRPLCSGGSWFGITSASDLEWARMAARDLRPVPRR
jgi:hypothetical protein